MNWTERRVDADGPNALDRGEEDSRAARDRLNERFFVVDIHSAEIIGEVVDFLGKFHDGGDDVFGRSTGDRDEFGQFPRRRRRRKRERIERKNDVWIGNEPIVR